MLVSFISKRISRENIGGFLMDFGYIFMFFGIAILSSIDCKNLAIGVMESVGKTSQHYPKWYIRPAKWVRKLFNIKHHYEIPRYVYFELFISIFFALLGPINLIICAATHCNPSVVGILIMNHVCLIIINTVFFLIMTLLLKR